ncbi:MAG TPA: hypothetical protein VN524_05175 [Hyphomicrobiaceae bacterium]|nr:hypothetical protein [Hyphomicrobiaceae bacterium]
MCLRAYRLWLSDRDIDPRSIVPCDAESNLAAIGRSDLRSTLRSDLPATERSVVNPVLGSAVHSNTGRR